MQKYCGAKGIAEPNPRNIRADVFLFDGLGFVLADFAEEGHGLFIFQVYK